MPEANNVILGKLLDRLYASLVQGPCLNCRPHSSRQRIDLSSLQSFQHLSPSEIIPKLLIGSKRVEVLAKVPPFRGPPDEDNLTDQQKTAKRAFDSQSRLLGKLRDVTEDAFAYEQETGENALYIGYPLVSVSPGSEVLGESSSRVLAPVALIAVEMVVKRGASQSVVFTTKGAGVDLVVPNFPLLAWLEQQTGRDTSELFADEEGTQPYREINEIAKLLAEALSLSAPPEFAAERAIEPIPRTEQLPAGVTFLNSALVGLFPVSNQGLLRDMKAMIQGEPLAGPVQNFLAARVSHYDPALAGRYERPPKHLRRFTDERLVCAADPCQARATRLAKEAPVLVIHGPPGTGKSQTIANIIGDHLARGERILMVCDKRTAIDVVHNRLQHLGLADLCAVVHDAQRDQRPLYMKIRDYLDTLVERKSNATAETQLKAADDELQKLHLELSGYFSALAEPPKPGQPTFHDLVGDWFGTEAPTGLLVDDVYLAQASLADLEPAQPAIAETFDRACKADYPRNPWADAAGMELGEFLSRPATEFQSRLSKLLARAETLDRTCADGVPPLDDSSLTGQAEARGRIAELLLTVDRLGLAEARQNWFNRPIGIIIQTLDQLKAMDASVNAVAAGSLDAELATILAAKPPSLNEINLTQEVLREYDKVAAKWYGFIYATKKSAAEKAATPFGLKISPETSGRLQKFLDGLKSRLICQDFLQRTLGGTTPPSALMGDAALLGSLNNYRSLLTALRDLRESTPASLEPMVADALARSASAAADNLKQSASRARALETFLGEVQQSVLFSTKWLAKCDAEWRAGKAATPMFQDLATTFELLEMILRLRLAYVQVPAALRDAVAGLIYQSAEPETGLRALKHALLAKEISVRIRTNPFLQQVDQEKMERCFRRYREVEMNKRNLVRDVIVHRWVTLQKTRLLAGTGTQLNTLGSALKRRLLTRGERAMKLRQMILHGANSEESDPLFDVCPVWMASPATVAQIFPRKAIFNLVVFDEASQCRLEEALPVLLRGQRVVIAGDPKQLPPTRFFESAVVESDVEEAETDQDLFEQQQGETEDLLGAALNIEVQQSYLDVHYRSRDEALIGFSNKNFYQDRLQPIPGYPGNKSRTTAIKVIRADGLYEKRGNKKEAEAVCDIMQELLSRPSPPSIGVACFNLTQRDVILDTLEERCEANLKFAQQLEEARKRRGTASFEGLFVKNLENVQGDERDHIIISTTFGLDEKGKFRRNFGPLGRAGGGRRLNVLVTRAREKIHLVTSIPTTEYRVLPEIESGQAPGGRWLLYAYLNYAEGLERKLAEEQTRLAQARVSPKPVVRVDGEEQASRLSVNLAHELANRHGLSSQVPWGNPGFCVDIVLQHPIRPEDVTIGVLCDMTRFPHAADSVEWELFRTAALEVQGWKFHRVWSTTLYADPGRHVKAIAEASRRVSEAVPVQKPQGVNPA